MADVEGLRSRPAYWRYRRGVWMSSVTTFEGSNIDVKRKKGIKERLCEQQNADMTLEARVTGCGRGSSLL